MVGKEFCIRGIGCYIPQKRIPNSMRAGRFSYDLDALKRKIGFVATSQKEKNLETSDMCICALEDLTIKLGGLDLKSIDLIVVVTQHPDGFGLPHCSAIVHSKLNLPDTCFAFDISLGCSGFVAALATISGFLDVTGGERAILFTADPYSISTDANDRNTAMIFGDASSATLIEKGTDWCFGAFDLGNKSGTFKALQRDNKGKLRMNGRAVFDFCVLNVPKSIERTLEGNGLKIDDVDEFVLHPGSRFVFESIQKRAKLPPQIWPACKHYGNTVSSSIPLLLSEIDRTSKKTVLISGFGVGLGWATTILRPGKELHGANKN